MSFNNRKFSLVAAAVVGACLNTSHAAQIVVDSAFDNGINCTLRNAIDSVNQGPNDGFIPGCNSSNADPLGTNDEIVFDLSLDNQTIVLAGIELFIERPVSIDASNLSNITIDANTLTRVMQVDITEGDANVSLQNLSLTNGRAPLSPNNAGGGIFIDGIASVEIKNCTLSGNTATFGGGIYNGSSGVLTVSDSTITANSGLSGGGGGLLAISDSTYVKVERSNISNNMASFDGGGITSNASMISIIDSTISQNSSGRSGGGINARGGLVIRSSTLSANSTEGFGGAIASLGSAQNPRIYNSTISGNSSATGAGTFHTPSPTSFSLQNSTMVGNISSETAFSNYAGIGISSSIFAQIGGVVDCNEFNTITSGQYSIIEGTACGTVAATVLTGLEPLADNGGLTMTHALLSDSTAVDAADPNSCPDTDQRGVARDDACDIGSYEFEREEQDSIFVIPLEGKRAVVIPL